MANNFNELVNQRKTYYNQLNSYQQYLEQQKQLEQEQAEKAKREEEKKNANFFERAAATVGDFLGQVGVGISKGIEGIVDTASGIVGAVGGLFDKDFQEQVKKNIAYDWTYNKIQNPLSKATKLSYINDASESAQNIIRGVPQTIGQLVPSIAANAVLPGSGMPTLIASAAGSGMEEAYNDGADYYAGFGYGSLVGAVEGTIEKVSGGMARNVFGKGMLDNVATKIASNTYAQKGVKYLLDAGGEALEEYISTTINPYLKRMTYDPNAPLSTQSERIESAIVGGLASMGYRSTIGKIGEKQRNVLENLETVQEIEQKANQQWSKGKLTDSQYNKYSSQIAQAYENAGENLRRMNPDKRSKFMKKYNLERMFDDEGHYLGMQNTQKVGVNLNDLSNADIFLSQDVNNARTINEANARGVLDTKNKTPATAGVKFSIKKDADGKEYVNIDTDQHLFDGKTASEMRQVAGDVIRNSFQGKAIDNMIINARSRNEYLGSEYTKVVQRAKPPIYEAKMRGATELDNFIKTAKFVRHEEAKHPKSFNKDGYDIYQVDFALGDKFFSGEMLVAKNGEESKFYDIVKIKNGTIPRPATEVTGNTVQSGTVGGDNSIDSSIRNNSENVNTNSQKSEKNTQVSSKTDKNALKSTKQDEKETAISQKNGTVTPKESIIKQSNPTEQTQNDGAKYNRKAYSPRLWGKESELRFKPTSKPLNAEQKEALEWFGQMNIHRNFADVVFVDEMPLGANGAYLNGVIYISLESEIPLKTALMHETTHHLEGSKAYYDYAKFIIADLESNESVLRKINDITGNHWTVEEIRKAYGERYGKENVNDIMSEVVAVYTSEYMFTDSYRLQKLASKNKTLFQKVLNFIKSIGYYFKNKVGKTAQDKKVYEFLNEAQKLYEKALAAADKPAKTTKTKLSINEKSSIVRTKDNLGNELTAEQLAYFKNSKVRDENGNLKVVYHGTTNGNFNTFSYKYLGMNGTSEGKGFYFTDDIKYAEAYTGESDTGIYGYSKENTTVNKAPQSKVFKVYIDIEKPLDADKKTITRNQLAKLIKNIDPDGNGYLSNYGDVSYEGYSNVLEQALQNEYEYSDNDVDLVHSILNSAGLDYSEFYGKLRDVLGYDGIISPENGRGTFYIPFNSNQIKEITNLKPTNNDDVRFSLNKSVDKTASNDVNSSKGAENGRERTTRLEDVPSGDRNGQGDSSTRFGSVQKLQSKKETREVDKIDEQSARDIETQAQIKDFVNSVVSANELKKISSEKRDDIELIESVAQDVGLTPIFCNTDYGTMGYRIYEDRIYLNKEVTPDEFGEILEIERPYKTIPQGQKYVGMSKARLQKIKERFPNAMLTRMRIDDFLKASGNEAIRRKIYSETAPLDVKDLQNVDSDMFLEVDLLGGKVISHEGRHRATALQQAGYTHIDVAIVPMTKETQVLHNVQVKAQESDKTITFGQLIPIDMEFIQDDFINRKSDLKYSLSKGEQNKLVANYTRPKVYSKKETAQIIEDIIDSNLHINDYYGLVKAKDKNATITKLFEDVNKLDGKELDEALYKVADNIIEVAKYRNMYEDMGEVNVQDYEAIKAYRNKLDLSGIKEEIKYRYDDNNVAYLHWSAGKKGGVSIADAVAELREMGVIIRADNDADAFFEMIDTYETLKSEVKAKVEEYSQDKFADSEISQMKDAIVSDLKAKLAVSGKKSKIQEFKDYYNTRIERLRAEVKHSYAYSRALVKLKTTYDRFKALKNKPADELVVPIVEEMTKAMQKTMTYTGNISKNVRNILRDNFSPIHSKLMELCEQTDNPYIEALRDIANAPSNENLTVQEINVLADVFTNAIHVCRNYDKVFWENKRQSETELATNAVEDLKFNSDFIPSDRKFIFNRIMLELNAPYAVFDEMSAFAPDGFMNKAYAELVTGEIKKQSLLSDVDYLLKDVYDKYEKDMKDWSKATVDFAGGKITPAQQITMVMSWERPQARQHMENGGVLVLNEKYARKGDFVKAQYDNAIRKQVTQQDIDELKSSLKPAQQEYIKVAEKIFDDVTRKAKIETDVALRGVSNVESGKYIPINVVDEGLAKRLGSEYGEDANIFKRNQSVYSYGFNKETKANATNCIAIDDITRVIARHTEDIATYYGYGQFINSFNRIINKKTESGATLRATLNSINSNFVPYIQRLLKDVQGIGNGRDKAQKVLDTVRNYSYKATLGLNIKSWAMQFVSLFSARGAGLKHSEIMAGVAAFMRHRKQTLAELDAVNPLAHARFRDGFNTDLGRIKAEKGLLGKVDDVTDKLISPMSTIDKWVNGALWEACKKRTNGDIESASKMFNDVLIKTQANWNASLRPQIMRSKNAIIKFATMYMSEPLQLLTRLYTSVVKVQTLLKKKKCDRYNTDAEFREKVDKQLKDAMGNLRVQVTNVAGSMVITTAIALLFKELLKTAGDDDDEKWQDKIAVEFGSQIAGMFPIIRDMYSALQGYDITNSAYTGLQNIVNAGNNLAELSTTLISGKQYDSTELASLIRQTVLGLSQTFGIPVRNAEKYVKAIVDKLSPQTAYEWNSLFKSRSASKYYKALENASGNENLQSTILKVMLKDRGVSVQSNAVRDELLRLYNNDINALPTQVSGSYTKDGKKIELSQSQHTQVQKNYAKAGVEVEKMMSLADYQKADDETKGRAIKLLYNYYYKAAMQNYTGDELDKFGLFAQGVDPYKLAMYASYINAMKKQYANAAQTSRTSNTLKQAIVKYVQSTNLTMTQKYMLLGYCGYINASGGTQVKSYINSLSLTQDQKSKLYTYSGYKD